MIEHSDETLSAYIDNELAPAVKEALERDLAGDPALRRRLAALEEGHRRLRRAYENVPAEGVPERFAALLESAGRPAGPFSNWRVRFAQLGGWAPAAAALAVGMLVGVVLAPRDSPLFVRSPSGSAALSVALSKATSEARTGVALAVGDETVLARLSFTDREGRYCRHVSMTRADFVACAESGVWVVEAFSRGGVSTDTVGYREAGDATPAEVAAAIDRLGATSVLDASDESALIARAWRSGAP